MLNPFIFGSVAKGRQFANREKELKLIKSEITAGQNMVIISPRRYGKTSLVVKTMADNKFDFIQINLELITGEADLSNALIRKMLSFSPLEKLKHHLKNFRIQPAIKIDPASGEVSAVFNPDERNMSVYLEDALEFPEKIAKSRKKKMVVVFDEFQEIRRISDSLERKMRAIFQHHANVVYIFIGSQESMIKDIFQSRKNPFYKFARQIVLEKIPQNEFKKFIAKGFKRAGCNAVGIIDKIITRTENHPYYTQQLCHEICIHAEKGKKLKEAILLKAEEEILREHNASYLRWWKEMDNTEKKILIGIAAGDAKVTSQTFLRKYGIKAASTANSALKRLIKSGEVVRENGLKIEDVFWSRWIQKIR